MLKIAIVDDNENDIDDLSHKLKQISVSFNLYTFQNADRLLEELKSGKSFDIIFMDIQLKEKNGIEIVKTINSLGKNIDIIYCSAYIDFAQDIFETGCVYFLLKPINRNKLKAAFDKIFEKYNDDCILIKYDHKVHRISIKNLAFIESDTKWLNFVYTDGSSEQYYLSFEAVENRLPPKKFVRTHKSYIVNLEYMTGADRTEVAILEKWRIPISRTFIKSVRDGITFFLGGL